MLLFGKMILAEALMTVGAAPQGLLIALMAASCRRHDLAMHTELFGVVHKKDLLFLGAVRQILSTSIRNETWLLVYYSKSVLSEMRLFSLYGVSQEVFL